MRGTQRQSLGSNLRIGIIPAYAGNTVGLNTPHVPFGDHPRVCGEHARHGIHNFRQLWIIPAYAGNTYWKLHELYVRRDHPRVCGEHVYCPPPVAGTRGSSPRMRGTRLEFAVLGNKTGIIPAYAGNTDHDRILEVGMRDHPRVCGEHSTHTFSCGHNRGSSPRMRGTLHRAHQ